MPVRRNGFGRDDYRTPPALIEYIHEQILPSLALASDTQYYDPAAGDGRLLEPVCAATVHNFDVCPRAEPRDRSPDGSTLVCGHESTLRHHARPIPQPISTAHHASR